ncbi:glycosyltransferase family 4 protein [Magnetococcus sp. PR-3]|uniref:glycosyltransferase family 4 protein n=1 Tax=Magnetococcus sp. PR-3 TaxID=3120355 RepID=UPI002FCDEB11
MHNQKPRLLCLVPADYAVLKEKGVDHIILERDENGFFERVISVHPYAYRNRCIDLNTIHRVYDFGIDWLNGSRSKALRHLLAPFHLLRTLFRIHRLIRQERIDIIRSNDPFLCGLLGLALKRLNPHVKLCMTIHSDYRHQASLDTKNALPRIFGSRDSLAWWMESFTIRRYPWVFPIRQHLIDDYKKLGFSDTRMAVFPHGMDFHEIDAISKEPIETFLPTNRPKHLLSFVGRFVKDNHIYGCLDIARKIAETRDDFLLVMLGEGLEWESVRQTVAQDPILQKHVLLCGFQPNILALSLRKAASVNLSLVGGFSLIEACASGRPVIAYDVQWHKELIEDGVTGRLFPEGAVDQVAQAVIELLDDPKQADRLGKHGRERAIYNHEINHVHTQKTSLFQRVLDTP